MIDYGLITLFALQCVFVGATLYAWTAVKREVDALKSLQEGIRGVTTSFEALKENMATAMDHLRRRQDEVDQTPKALIARFNEVETNLGKADRLLEKLDSKLNSVIGRVGAITKALKGQDDETDPASEDESTGTLFQPPGSQPEERPAAHGIPRGFGKVPRRAA